MQHPPNPRDASGPAPGATRMSNGRSPGSRRQRAVVMTLAVAGALACAGFVPVEARWRRPFEAPYPSTA
jgi:hypothetical protein